MNEYTTEEGIKKWITDESRVCQEIQMLMDSLDMGPSEHLDEIRSVLEKRCMLRVKGMFDVPDPRGLVMDEWDKLLKEV